MAAKTKVISNEKIIAALLQHGTVKEAAAAAGTAPRTIYERIEKDREFQSEYAEAKANIIRKAVFTINERLGAAVDTVTDIMNDKEINAAVRLQAAQTIINNAAKFSERLTKEEKAAGAGEDLFYL